VASSASGDYSTATGESSLATGVESTATGETSDAHAPIRGSANSNQEAAVVARERRGERFFHAPN
jgi:hypothetical protein